MCICSTKGISTDGTAGQKKTCLDVIKVTECPNSLKVKTDAEWSKQMNHRDKQSFNTGPADNSFVGSLYAKLFLKCLRGKQ